MDAVTPQPVVALYAPIMQSGKTITATHLIEQHGYRLVKFAGPLKDMLKPVLYELGLDANACVDGHLKEAPIAALGGITPRRMLQTLGTEWGRGTVAGDLWVQIAARKIREASAGGWPIVNDDMRWPNEYDLIRKMNNALLVKIVRPGETPYSAHGSEGLLEDKTFDYTIINNSTLEDLYRMVEYVLCRGPGHGARALNQKEVIVAP